ncbi:MAG: O-antigen ligase family protein [Geobacteraceae bacterium]|nr:O-antigen ligase family protein [Geobacteraceae bacterium]
MLKLIPIIFAVILIFMIFVLNIKIPQTVLLLVGLGGAAFYLRSLITNDRFFVLGVILLYLPFAKIAPFDLAKGVNLTNILVLSLFAKYYVFSENGRKTGDLYMRRAVYFILFFMVISFFQALFRDYSPPAEELITYLIQFTIPWIFYLAMTACLSSLEDVKHVLLFSWVGYSLTLCFGFNEFLDKRWNGSIERSRVSGTLGNANTFAAYIVYLLPLVGSFLFYPGISLKALLTITLFLAIKVMLSTFSRGSYLALFGAGLTVMYFKGRFFFAAALLGGVLALFFFPGLMPDSVKTRLIGHTFASGQFETANLDENLDRSSETRLILWRAAEKMVVESPLIGKGLLSFPQIAGEYLDEPVEERDTHNMFFKIAVYMGLPALAAYLFFIGRTFVLAWRMLKASTDALRKSIALGAMGSCVSLLISCMFGSRMENIELLCYFMTLCAVISFLSRYEESEA